MDRVCECVYVCREFINKGKVRQSETAYFLPWRHEVLVSLEDMCQSLLDVFLFHAGQHRGGQEQWQTPLLPTERRCVSAKRHARKRTSTN